MVIRDFDMFSPFIGPCKANAVLLINANRVLAYSITVECFQAVSRRVAELRQRARFSERAQLSQRRAPKLDR
jgi:hypothetical protein